MKQVTFVSGTCLPGTIEGEDYCVLPGTHVAMEFWGGRPGYAFASTLEEVEAGLALYTSHCLIEVEGVQSLLPQLKAFKEELATFVSQFGGKGCQT